MTVYEVWPIVYEDDMCIISPRNKNNKFICDRFNIPVKVIGVYWNRTMHNLPLDFCERFVEDNLL